MSKIFISYRRVDSEGYVGRLYDQLLQYFDEREIFRDLDTIQPGEDFVAAIERVIGICDALIAVIGPQWLTIRDQNGYRRLDNPNDYVRLEISTALKRNILVLPVLVAKATMPQKSDLPNDLSDLSRRNAIELSNDRFSFDVERIAHAIGGSYAKLIAKVGSGFFGESGKIIVIDCGVTIGEIELKNITKPLTIQVEKGAHSIHVVYIPKQDLMQDFWLQWKTRYQRTKRNPKDILDMFKVSNSNILSLNLKIGQTQYITIEREMIMPAQHKTQKIPLDTKNNNFFDWEEQISPPQYRIVIKPY